MDSGDYTCLHDLKIRPQLTHQLLYYSPQVTIGGSGLHLYTLSLELLESRHNSMVVTPNPNRMLSFRAKVMALIVAQISPPNAVCTHPSTRPLDKGQ